MRELGFRAFIKPLGRYATGLDTIQFHKCCDVTGAGIWSVVTVNEGIFEGDDIVIEQDTGLEDKNGKEIYEGDIIKQLMYVLDGKERITTWVVRWNNDDFCYELHRVSGALYGDSMLSTCESKDCEVIGNIHESNMEKLDDV